MAAKVVTIEIGNDFIKICEAQQMKGKSVTVHNAISVETPDGAMEDGIIRDMAAVADKIRSAMAEEQIAATAATFILSSARVVTREVVLPIVKKEKIQETLIVNASEYFPVNIDEYVLSYTILEMKNTKEEKKTRLLVFAAPEMMVQGYYDLAKQLNMKVNAVDYIGNSTLQLIKIQIDERPTLVIQMGMDSTIVSVMNHNVLQLQRNISYGESLLLNAVMEDKKVSTKAAIELMAQAKLVKPYLEDDKITSSLKYLVSNVNRVVEYYSGRNREAPLQTAIIIGDGADVLGLDELFTNELNLHTERITLLKNVESYNRIKLSTSLLKLYMANIGATISPINFQTKAASSTDSKEVKEKGSNSPVYYAVAGLLALVAVGLFAVPFAQYRSSVNKKENLQSDIDAISDIQKTVSDYYTAYDKISDLEGFHQMSMTHDQWTLKFFETIEKVAPKGTRISALSITNGMVTMNAAFQSKEQVADFVIALKEVPNIIDVSVSQVAETRENEEEVSVITAAFQCSFVADPEAYAQSLEQAAQEAAAAAAAAETETEE